MSRKGKFFVGFAATAITFGSLWATLGSEKFNQHRCSPCHQMERCGAVDKSCHKPAVAAPQSDVIAKPDSLK